jgi:uncharacterized protein YabE (DUF348 family)
VTVTVDGMSAIVYTHLDSVADLLADMQLELRPEDRLLIAPETPLHSGLAIDIQRARPLLLDIDGRVSQVYTQAALLQEALAERNLTVGSQHDLISIDDQPAALDAALPPVAIGRGRNLPGLPGVYPWRGTQIQPVAIAVRHAAPLTVQVGNLEWSTWSTASTVGEALAELGMVFYEGDRVQPELGAPLGSGHSRVVIERSKPVVIATASHPGHSQPRRDRGRSAGRKQPAADRLRPGRAWTGHAAGR